MVSPRWWRQPCRAGWSVYVRSWWQVRPTLQDNKTNQTVRAKTVRMWSWCFLQLLYTWAFLMFSFSPSDFATILHHSCFVYLFIYQRETLELMEPLLQLFYILFCSHRDFQLLLQSHSFNSGFHFFFTLHWLKIKYTAQYIFLRLFNSSIICHSILFRDFYSHSHSHLWSTEWTINIVLRAFGLWESTFNFNCSIS